MAKVSILPPMGFKGPYTVDQASSLKSPRRIPEVKPKDSGKNLQENVQSDTSSDSKKDTTRGIDYDTRLAYIRKAYGLVEREFTKCVTDTSFNLRWKSTRPTDTGKENAQAKKRNSSIKSQLPESVPQIDSPRKCGKYELKRQEILSKIYQKVLDDSKKKGYKLPQVDTSRSEKGKLGRESEEISILSKNRDRTYASTSSSKIERFQNDSPTLMKKTIKTGETGSGSCTKLPSIKPVVEKESTKIKHSRSPPTLISIDLNSAQKSENDEDYNAIMQTVPLFRQWKKKKTNHKVWLPKNSITNPFAVQEEPTENQTISDVNATPTNKDLDTIPPFPENKATNTSTAKQQNLELEKKDPDTNNPRRKKPKNTSYFSKLNKASRATKTKVSSVGYEMKISDQGKGEGGRKVEGEVGGGEATKSRRNSWTLLVARVHAKEKKLGAKKSKSPGEKQPWQENAADSPSKSRKSSEKSSSDKKGDSRARTANLAAPKETFFYIAGNNGVALVESTLLELGWKRSTNKYSDNFKLKWVECKSHINYNAFKEGIQMVNRIPNCHLLTNKMGLLNSLQRYERVQHSINPGKDYRLKSADFLPETFRVDDQNERKQFFDMYKEDTSGSLWICKPCGMNQGKGIYIVRDLEDFHKSLEERDETQKKSHRPMERIVQRYIMNPLLLDGRKFDIRAYMLIASTTPYLVLYHKGYVRLCLYPYDNNEENLTAHLTNQFIQKKDRDYNKNKEDTVWSMDKFNAYINTHLAEEKGLEKDWVYNTLTIRMKQIMHYCFNAVKHKMKSRLGYFDLYGLDFMVDEDMRIYLIEVNVNPCLAVNCAGLKEIVPQVVKEAILISIESFEKSKRGQHLIPLQSLKTFQIIYASSFKQRSTSPVRGSPTWQQQQAGAGAGPGSMSPTSPHPHHQRARSLSPRHHRSRSLSPAKDGGTCAAQQHGFAQQQGHHLQGKSSAPIIPSVHTSSSLPRIEDTTTTSPNLTTSNTSPPPTTTTNNSNKEFKPLPMPPANYTKPKEYAPRTLTTVTPHPVNMTPSSMGLKGSSPLSDSSRNGNFSGYLSSSSSSEQILFKMTHKAAVAESVGYSAVDQANQKAVNVTQFQSIVTSPYKSSQATTYKLPPSNPSIAMFKLAGPHHHKKENLNASSPGGITNGSTASTKAPSILTASSSSLTSGIPSVMRYNSTLTGSIASKITQGNGSSTRPITPKESGGNRVHSPIDKLSIALKSADKNKKMDLRKDRGN